MSKGVLLVNLGSPDSPDQKDVKRYLGNFNGRTRYRFTALG